MMVPEPYRMFVFLVGLVLFLVFVAVGTTVWALAGRPVWLQYALTLSPLLIVVLAGLVLGLPLDSLLPLTALAVALVVLVHLFWSRVILR